MRSNFIIADLKGYLTCLGLELRGGLLLLAEIPRRHLLGNYQLQPAHWGVLGISLRGTGHN